MRSFIFSLLKQDLETVCVKDPFLQCELITHLVFIYKAVR